MFTGAQFHFTEGEEKRLEIHKHWFVFFVQALGLIILFILPFIFIPIAGSLIQQGGAAVAISAGIVLFLSALWSLVMWCKLFAIWTDYYLDVWIVTNRRIIDIDQIAFFHRDISTILELGKIEDVKTGQHGFFSTLLDYGDIQVQTAGTRDEFVMHGIAHPRSVEQVVRQAMRESIASGEESFDRLGSVAG